MTVGIGASFCRIGEAAVQPEALWTQVGRRISTNLIPFKVAAEGIEPTHRRFTTCILAARRRGVRKAAIRRHNDLAIVVTGHVIRRIALFRSLDGAITAERARPPKRQEA